MQIRHQPGHEEKFLFEPLKENPAFPYPFFKPVSLPDY
jgi:hypothetical protein